tara:strand:- start:1097 stop:1222 length:126 start_codon:yes stop_codon:yes gene_type:complete
MDFSVAHNAREQTASHFSVSFFLEANIKFIPCNTAVFDLIK